MKIYIYITVHQDIFIKYLDLLKSGNSNSVNISFILNLGNTVSIIMQDFPSLDSTISYVFYSASLQNCENVYAG